MKHLLVPLVLVACHCVSAEIAIADGALTLQAVEAAAQIEPRDQGQRRVALPGLEISVIAQLNCPEDAEAESLVLSVADTLRRYGPEEIADATVFETLVNVPASQISPIPSADFCIVGKPLDKMDLLVPGIASAQLSLRCRNAFRASVHFASIALPLRLVCVSGEDQESSADK